VIPATAQAQAPQCGEIITTDVRFTVSVSGCSADLVVGADDVTIDLDGHALEGTGAQEWESRRPAIAALS